MAEPKWTPGPWEDMECNCSIHKPDSEDHYIGQGVAHVSGHANARLIAAAPEMAELLEEMVVHLSEDEDPFSELLEDRARNLLNRIHGETE